jgi:hypothetical protein
MPFTNLISVATYWYIRQAIARTPDIVGLGKMLPYWPRSKSWK